MICFLNIFAHKHNAQFIMMKTANAIKTLNARLALFVSHCSALKKLFLSGVCCILCVPKMNSRCQHVAFYPNRRLYSTHNSVLRGAQKTTSYPLRFFS